VALPQAAARQVVAPATPRQCRPYLRDQSRWPADRAGQGGGIFVAGPSNGRTTATVSGTIIEANRASGGAGTTRGGTGQYIGPGGTVAADLFTLILANDASTSDDDVFGNLFLL
jgi:hypothetical protein